MDSSSFYPPPPLSRPHPSHHQNASCTSNSPPELSTSSPDSSSSDGTGGEESISNPQDLNSRRNTLIGIKSFQAPPHNRQVKEFDPSQFSLTYQGMNQFPNHQINGNSIGLPSQQSNGMNGSGKEVSRGKSSNASQNSALSDLTSSDDEVSIFGNESDGIGGGGTTAVVELGNGMFSYTKGVNDEGFRNGNHPVSGPSNATHLEKWPPNENCRRSHQLTNGSLNQPFEGNGVGDHSAAVRNGRNPPTTIPRLHSSSSNSRIASSGLDGTQVDGVNLIGNGDEEMFESLIQEGSFDPPSARQSMSPQHSSTLLPQSGLSISTAPDRIPPSYQPFQYGWKHQGSGQNSAGIEGEEGTPPLSADPSVLSSRRNSNSDRQGDFSMEDGILSGPPSIAAMSGDDAPASSSTSQDVSTNLIIKKTPKAKSTSTTTGLNPQGEIPFSSNKEDIVRPLVSELNQAGTERLQVHVHGLPREGAKSRVETQVTMRLELVREKSDQGIDPHDEKQWERIGSFTHLKLPPLSGSKRSQKKYSYQDVDPETTLFVDAVIVKASPPHDRVAICDHCSSRESRKAQRTMSNSIKKKSANSKLNNDDLSPNEDEYEFFGIDKDSPNSREQLRDKKLEAESRRSIVFNCGDYLEFEDGQVILPARITCYCRHHKEKLGFCIIFTMRDWQSNVVATGSTPPIMITDDHKGTKGPKEKPAIEVEGDASKSATPGASGSGSATSNKKTGKSKSAAKTSAPALIKGGKASERGVGRTTYNSSVSRSNSFSTDNPPVVTQSETLPTPTSTQPTSSATTASKKKERAKPYDKASSSRVRNRSESGTTSRVSSPQQGLVSGNVTRSATPATPTSPPPHQPSPFSSNASIGQNEDWTSFAAAAGFMSRSASDSGRSMTTANAFSPISNSSFTSEPQAIGVPNPPQTQQQVSQSVGPPAMQISPVTSDPGSQLPPHMQGSLSSVNLQTNLQSTPAFDLERFLRDAQDGVPVDSSGLQEFIALNGGRSEESQVGNGNGNGNGNEMDVDVNIADQQQIQFSHSEPQSDFSEDRTRYQQASPSGSMLQRPQQPNPISNQSPPPSSSLPSLPVPRVEKLIPGEGPTSGGIEVTILGSGFSPGLRCVFGDVQAPETKVWASNTLVCILPPSQSPGPVVVSLKRIMETGQIADFDFPNAGGPQSNPLRFFTYVDKTDRALMELALQVVGLQMTGQMQSARDVAMRVVGSGAGGGSNGPSPSSHSRAGSSSTPSGQSRSIGGTDEISGLFATGRGSSQSFQTSVLGFLSLLDVDLSSDSLPNGAPRLDALRLANSQGHTLLHLAVILGFHKLVEALLAREHPAPVNARDNNGYTALHFAALHGRLTIARNLLSSRARDDLVNAEGKVPLELAREKDQVDVEMLLTEHASETARRRMNWESSSLSESEISSEDEAEKESAENSDEGSSIEGDDIDEDNMSTSASHLETSSDEGSSQEQEDEEADDEIFNSQADLNIDSPPPVSSMIEKGNQTPPFLSTPKDEKKDLFSSRADEKKGQESSKLEKEKEKEAESNSGSPGSETNLAFKDWLIQAGDSVRAGHGLEWAASNLPSGRRALQLIPRPNMGLHMHMPAVPVFHLALPATPRFSNLPWTSNSSSAASTPSAASSSSKGKDKELSQEGQDPSKDGVINMCKSIVEESALWLNPLYQPLDASPPPTYESALASTSKDDEHASKFKGKELAEGKEQGLQLESGEEAEAEAEAEVSQSSPHQSRPPVTSRSTWNGKSSEKQESRPSSALADRTDILPPSSPSASAANPSDSMPDVSTPVPTSSNTTSTSNTRRRARAHSQPQRRGLRDDAMLIFFWIPALILVILLLACSHHSSIFSLDELLSFIPGPIASATGSVGFSAKSSPTNL